MSRHRNLYKVGGGLSSEAFPHMNNTEIFTKGCILRKVRSIRL